MKKVFKTLSAILLATACLTPGLAWAASNTSVSLTDSGLLRASDATAVHSALVELEFVSDNADKVTDVVLRNAPDNALSSVVYDAAAKKATIAVSTGDAALNSNDVLLGNVSVIAQGASIETPVVVQAKLVAYEYIDSADSSAAAENGGVPGTTVSLTSTESTTPAAAEPSDWAGMGYGIEGSGDNGGNLVNTNTNGVTTADYKANGVVTATQTGQSAGANTGLVKTGDVLAICGIALGAAAVAVVVIMLVSRKKSAARR